MDLAKLKSTEDKVLKSLEDAPRSQLLVCLKYLDYEIAAAFKKETV
jgi:hypothetical protein